MGRKCEIVEEGEFETENQCSNSYSYSYSYSYSCSYSCIFFSFSLAFSCGVASNSSFLTARKSWPHPMSRGVFPRRDRVESRHADFANRLP